MAPNLPKKGKIAIFAKLKGLEFSFVFLFIFHSTEDIITLKNVNMSEQVLCNLSLSEDKNKNALLDSEIWRLYPFWVGLRPILGPLGPDFGVTDN